VLTRVGLRVLAGVEGRRQDSGNGGFDNGWWEKGSRDVFKDDMFFKIVSKVLVDKGVLGGRWEEILFLVFVIGWLMGSDVGEDVKTKDRGGGDGGTCDDVGGTVRDVEEWEVFDVAEGRPNRSGRWRVPKLGGLQDDGLEDTSSDVKRTWVIPSVVRALKNLKDGGSGVRNILLVDVIKGRPGGDGDVGESRGGDDGGLRGSERYLRQLAPL